MPKAGKVIVISYWAFVITMLAIVVAIRWFRAHPL